MRKLTLVMTGLMFVLTISGLEAGPTKANPANKTNTVVVATKNTGKGFVSFNSKTNFYVDFGYMKDVVWRNSGNFDEASFTKDGVNYTAYYDSDSKLVGTTTYKKFSDIPASAQKSILAKYSDYKLGPVVYFEDNQFNETNMVLYDNMLEGADNYFVELTKDNDKIILLVNPDGDVDFFKKL